MVEDDKQGLPVEVIMNPSQFINRLYPKPINMSRRAKQLERVKRRKRHLKLYINKRVLNKLSSAYFKALGIKIVKKHRK
jgi:hypothetical protein